MSYLVSLVVPTKNRYQYLKFLIKLVDGFKLSELEMVIQDNSDDNTDILDYLKSFDSPNIKYYYCSDELTMSQNGELAIQHATGEYVCYIGDDDGVCRNIVDCVRWMKANGFDAAYNNNIWFTWNGTAKLFKPEIGYDIHSTEKELFFLVKKGGNLMGTQLPLIYHGIVRKAILDDVAFRYGTLFPSVPPDISGTICLASVIKECCELRTPVIINGSSQLTGGGVVAKGGVLDLDEVGFITQEDIATWEERIPPIWCGAYAWANSCIKTLNIIGLTTLSESFNIERCFANAVTMRPRKSILWKMGFKYSRSKLKFVYQIIIGFIRRYVKKIWRNRPGAFLNQHNVATIIEAEEYFMKHACPFN